MWGIVKKIAVFILGLILLVFIGWGAYNYTRGSKYTKKENKNYNWANIHEKLGNNSSLKNEWENEGFSYEECKDWISAGLKPHDADFAAWLRDIKKVDSDWVLNEGDDEKLREECQEWGTKKQKKDWKDIHIDFANNPELIEEWEIKGFNQEDCQKWISVGLKQEHSKLVYWLVKVKGDNYADPQKFSNHPTDQNWPNKRRFR